MSRRKETYSFLDGWKSLWKPDLDAYGGYNGATSDPTRIDPKVVEWAKLNCSNKPHFIKVINNNAANGRHSHTYSARNAVKLTVPSPFARDHFRELKRVVTLENEEGKTWKVSFGEIRSHPCWQQGWRRLAVDHNLKPGEVIVFVLEGNSRFHFTRFDEDGNILSEKGTRSPLNENAAVKKELITTHSDSQSHERPGSITNSEDKSHPRTSWKSKRAAELASRYDRSTDAECGRTQRSGSRFDGHGFGAPSQLLAPAHKEIAEAPCKRRRLRTVGEILSTANSNNESNLAISNEHAHDSEEAGSTSTADNPSTVTIVS